MSSDNPSDTGSGAGAAQQPTLQLAGSRLPDEGPSPYRASAAARPTPNSKPGRNVSLERKLLASKLSLLFEQAMPRIWLLLAVIGLFILVSMAGIWLWLGPLAHKVLLAVFAAAVAASLAMLARLPWPGRDEAMRRVERVSGVRHRPASSYEDSLTSAAENPAAQALWQAHRHRLAKMIGALRVGVPKPRTDRHDPLALRALLLLAVMVLTIAAGDSAADRIKSAFNFGPAALSAQSRLDVWATPPAYTAKPPIMLSDGSRPAGTLAEVLTSAAGNQTIELPEKSVLVVRLSGTDPSGLALEIRSKGTDKVKRIEVKALELVKAQLAKEKKAASKAAKSGKTQSSDAQAADAATTAAGDDRLYNTYSGDVGELRYVLNSSASVEVLSGRTEMASYQFKITPDQPPTIALLKLPKRSRRGALKLQYRIKDDYGVARAEAKFKILPEPAPDGAMAWARKPPRSGPRPKPPKPPVLTLSMPRGTARKGKAKSSHELAKHAWAGRKVRMTLVVKDHAGGSGRSESVDLALPERLFRNHIARAVIEQRRDLMWDPRARRDVLYALQALSADPEGFIKSKAAYLGLRSAYYRLKRSADGKTRQSVAEQLWRVAVRIEDGNLTDAQRRLRDAQDKLAKMLENGASEEEIAKAMQELRQALAEYLKQLAERAPKGQKNPNGTGNKQTLSSQDFEKMLRDLENMARSGNRESAQQMLSEMRDLIDRLQSGRQASSRQSRQQQQMMKMMDEFGDLIGKQQQLLDDTFKQQQQGEQQRQGRRQGNQGQQRRFGQQGQQGPKGQQRGNQPDGNQPNGSQPGSTQSGSAQLGNRQGRLRQKLDRLSKQMQQFGLQPPDQFGNAGEAMGKSKRALGRGNLGEGMRQERRALEQLRQGARSMAQQMLSRMARRYGMQRRGRQRSFDPLGRPRNRADSDDGGTELNSRVQVPDQFRAQRSRKILEELRRRLGESKRPTLELDYLERLLKQF